MRDRQGAGMSDDRTMDFEFEPGETTRLRHAPGWVAFGIAGALLLAEFAVVAAASAEVAERSAARHPDTLALVVVATLFAGAALQFLVLVMPPLVEVTDRRVLLRRRLGWDDPDMIPLDAIDTVRREGWRMRVSGGGATLDFPCPPPFAPRIRRAIEQGQESGAGGKGLA